MVRSSLAFAVWLVVLAAPRQPHAQAAQSATAFLRAEETKVQAVLRRTVAEGSAEARAREDEIRRLIGEFFDFDELAHRSLAKHWDAIRAPQRREFVDVLRRLVERNYLRHANETLAYEISYDGEDPQGDEATVRTTLRPGGTAQRGQPIRIDYRLRHRPAGWIVFDVVTDQVSLVNNYRSQFNRIITQNGFPELIRRMRERLENDTGTP